MWRKRILIIDDDPDIREVATMTLESMSDFDVLTADGGRDGVAAAHAAVPDVILLDVMMPELDGPATLELLRLSKATRGIPVIFLTAKVRTAERDRLRSLDVAGVIAKPFDPVIFGAQITDILESIQTASRSNS